MTEGAQPMRYFLGANSPQGFVSRFDQLERIAGGWPKYIIKGGPGSGKSTLMKKLSEALRRDGETVEEIYCASDCGSLDGLILHDSRLSIADGTPPHALEPQAPGAYDRIVNLCSCWDDALLERSAEDILELSRAISSLHSQADRFLTAYAALYGENHRLALEHTDRKKISEYARRFAAREFRHTGKQAHEDVRFLSAACDRGIVLFEDTAEQLASRIYLIDDEHGAASHLLLSELREHALAKGLDIVACWCPLDPFGKLEHLFFPELSLGFMTASRTHPISILPHRILHARRFTDPEGLARRKQRMHFNRRAAAEMLDRALFDLAAAKAAHDDLESRYISATDFSKTDAICEQLLEEIRRRGKR